MSEAESEKIAASDRVRAEWRARVAAEYGSAAITQNLVLWMMQAGAPPDLIDEGLAIVADELLHSRLSHEVTEAAGGALPPALDQRGLGLTRREARIELDILRAAVRVFCLGETVAVPLFRHLRAKCTQVAAKKALDRILKDEVRHRDFGWDLLDWLMTTDLAPQIPAWVERALPEMFSELDASYGDQNDAVKTDEGAIDPNDRAWGLASPREYAEILAQTHAREFQPRFLARGITSPR